MPNFHVFFFDLSLSEFGGFALKIKRKKAAIRIWMLFANSFHCFRLRLLKINKIIKTKSDLIEKMFACAWLFESLFTKTVADCVRIQRITSVDLDRNEEWKIRWKLFSNEQKKKRCYFECHLCLCLTQWKVTPVNFDDFCFIKNHNNNNNKKNSVCVSTCFCGLCLCMSVCVFLDEYICFANCCLPQKKNTFAVFGVHIGVCIHIQTIHVWVGVCVCVSHAQFCMRFHFCHCQSILCHKLFKPEKRNCLFLNIRIELITLQL